MGKRLASLAKALRPDMCSGASFVCRRRGPRRLPAVTDYSALCCGGRQPVGSGHGELHVDVVGIGDLGLLAGCCRWASGGRRRGAGQLERSGARPARSGAGRPQGGAGARACEGYDVWLVLQETHASSATLARARVALSALDALALRGWGGWGGCRCCGLGAASVDTCFACFPRDRATRALQASAMDKRGSELRILCMRNVGVGAGALRKIACALGRTRADA